MASPSLSQDTRDHTPSHRRRGDSLYSSIKQSSVLFRTMLKNVADQLTPEEVKSLAYIHSVGNGGREPNERPTALDVFQSLELRGIFSTDCLEPLVEVLEGIDRHDIVNTVVKDFKVKIIGIRRAESEPALMAGGDRRINKANLDLSDCEHYISPSLQTQQCTSPITPCESMSKHQKMELLHCLISDPELQPDIMSLKLDTSPTESIQSSLSSLSAPLSTQLLSTQFSSSGFVSSPEASVTSAVDHCKENSQSTRPSLNTQRSTDSFVDVGLDAVDRASPQAGDGRGNAGPHPPISHVLPHRMHWSISRINLGQRIVMRSNSALFKGGFSLSANGITGFYVRKPVSLIFKVYPFGLGKDKNQSLTMEVVTECRSEELKSIGKLNLTIELSMDCQLISTRSWKKPLKTFQIHDFLPHEIVTHRSSRSLDFTIEAFITFE